MLKLEEILETRFFWAVFSKENLVCLSLRGPLAEGRWMNHQGNLEHIAIDLTEKTPGNSPQCTSIGAKLVRETYRFLYTGSHHMPLDFSMFTSFQQKVFKEVQKIKPGTTTTYKEIATQAGNSGASRAVGAAISQNPFAYFLPTHRVLLSSGEIGTCTGGAGHLKKKLLEHERQHLI